MSKEENVMLSTDPMQEGFGEFWDTMVDALPDDQLMEQSTLWFFMVPALMFLMNHKEGLTREELREAYLDFANKTWDNLSAAIEEKPDDEIGTPTNRSIH